MGCSPDKQIKLYDKQKKNDNQFVLGAFPKNTFNIDLVEEFLSKPKVEDYFKSISNLESNDVNNEFLFPGLFQTIQTDFQNLMKRFELELIIPVESNSIIHLESFRLDYQPSSESDLDFFMPLFLLEFFLYSKSLIKKTKLKSITFVHSLSYSSDHITNQYRAVVPDFLHTQSIYICTKERNIDYIRNIIHHEIFHFFDWAHDKSFDDKDWRKLNVPGFEYGNFNLDGHWDNCTGFISFCSVCGLDEDKAEIFNHLMINPKDASNNPDEIIRMKIRRIICFLEELDPDGIGTSYEDYFNYVESVRIKLLY